MASGRAPIHPVSTAASANSSHAAAVSPKSRVGRAAASSNTDALAAVINDSTEGLIKGSRVWWRRDETTWLPAELHAAPAGDQCHVAVLESADVPVGEAAGSNAAAKLVSVPQSVVVPANPPLQRGITDLTHLSYLNEPGILYNLQCRYQSDAIYTFAGPVLIALNPCKALPLYTSEVANTYKAGARGVVNHLEPHIYLVAANAFRKMVREGESQSLIVNGESGAGKTETTKKAMQYFATLAGGTGVEDQVLETNPILEAFGNAKTLRNHNSSRFGKLIQIHFNASHHICGARIKTYLLEKSRVVYQLKGERSYHIFYQLISGVSAEQRVVLHLPDKPQAFACLAKSGCTVIDGVDDAAEFRTMCCAMSLMGISSAQQERCMQLLSGILWLSNLDFLPNAADLNNDSTLVPSGEALSVACGLLGVAPGALVQALTTKRLVLPDGIITKLLRPEEARDCRDALAKAIYSALFDWLVAQINVKLETGRKQSSLSISILDIYGFESFAKNSFEQLCINYANERLQQQFTRHLFSLEQAEYDAEGIDWTKIEFVDNQECVDLIELFPPKGLGVLAVLDSQCKFPKATDDTFVTLLKDTLDGVPNFTAVSRSPGDFVVLHYAGPVQYDSAGFLDKNKDTLSNDLLDLMSSSHHELLPTLGAAVREDCDATQRGGQTVGARFASQLRELIAHLDTTGLHFVRCIKPNAQLLPDRFDSPMTLQQLRCCGVLEVARIARAGFPTRYLHAQFAARYCILLPPKQQAEIMSGTGNALQAVKQLLDTFQLPPEQYQVGHTKIFFRPGVLGYVEDRWARLQNGVLKVQALWRMFVQRRAYRAVLAAAVTLQSRWRGVVGRRAFLRVQREARAQVVIAKHWRGYETRCRYRQLRWAAQAVQMAWRRWKLARRIRVRRHEREKREYIAKLEQERFDALRNSYGMDMDEVRAALDAYKTGRMTGAAAAGAVAGVAVTETGDAGGAASEGAAPAAAAALTKVDDAGAAASAAAALVEASAAPAAVPEPEASSLEAAATAAAANAEVVAAAVELDRLAYENLRLQKQLQLERSLKDRYKHKSEEQPMHWIEQVRVLQEYVEQVRQSMGPNAVIPPLPAGAPGMVAAGGTLQGSAAAAAAPATVAPVEAGAATAVAPPSEAAPAAPSPVAPAALGVASAPSVVVDGAVSPAPRAVSNSGRQRRLSSDAPGSPGGGAANRRRTGGGTTDVASKRSTTPTLMADSRPPWRPPSVNVPHSTNTPQAAVLSPPGSTTPAGSTAGSYGMRPDRVSDTGTSAQPTPPRQRPSAIPRPTLDAGTPTLGTAAVVSPSAVAAPPSALPKPPSASQKYVSNLTNELDQVTKVLDDDVDFIREVREGHAEAHEMDPAHELAKLKKKFAIWKREFKEKLKTTEDVLRKIDKIERRTHTSGGAPRSSGAAGAWRPTGTPSGAAPPSVASATRPTAVTAPLGAAAAQRQPARPADATSGRPSSTTRGVVRSQSPSPLQRRIVPPATTAVAQPRKNSLISMLFSKN